MPFLGIIFYVCTKKEFVKRKRLMDTWHKNAYFILWVVVVMLLFGQCRQEMPVTAFILIDADTSRFPVNKGLYGVSIEEINHAIDGGIYAEMIRNRSFEDALLPINCRFDALRKELLTPNGWTVPFLGEDTVIAWHKLSAGTHIALDRKEQINDKNNFSLCVGVYETSVNGRGGVVAEGFNGISLHKDDKYILSFFLKSAYTSASTIRIALEDSTKQLLSDVFHISPKTEWNRITHTFTATQTDDCASLVISTDSANMFWLDVVSLFPEKTWKGRKNGLRPDITDLVASLNPGFIRFPGGDFVEGYTAGSYPDWKESVGDIAERKPFWNIHAYGSTNGMGYHEYLQLCEDLGSEPVYVVNCGITSQLRRPRYEDIRTMDILVQNTLDAISYAVDPPDSLWGAARARNGHSEPFRFKYIKIGNENKGTEYTRRYDLFRKAIRDRFPDITVIASEYQPSYRTDPVDYHYNTGEMFLISYADMYQPKGILRTRPPVCIQSFSAAAEGENATLYRAVSEAAFMVGMEQSQKQVRQLSYSPLLANTSYAEGQPAAIIFDNRQVVTTPTYHVLDLFMNNRGNEVLKTIVASYQKPHITFGRAGIFMFDNAYDITRLKLDESANYPLKVLAGGWETAPEETLIPSPNKWNYVLAGDSSASNYTLSARVRKTKGSGQIKFTVRDNGQSESKKNHIALTLGTDLSELTYHSGKTVDTLSLKQTLPFAMNAWYNVRITCKDEFIRCYVNDSLLHDIKMKQLPSLAAVATIDTTNHILLLKVVNTTYRIEKTRIDLSGMQVGPEAEIIQLAGDPDSYNTFDNPETVVPLYRNISLQGSSSLIYEFPPVSVTLIRLTVPH